MPNRHFAPVTLAVVLFASRICFAVYPLELVGVAHAAWRNVLQAPRFRISRETTYLIAPLRADGRIDYAAAINAEFGADATPENNAAVDFIRVIGPKTLNRNSRAHFFERLGIAPLSDQGEYWQPLSAFRHLTPVAPGASRNEQSDARLAEEDRAKERPWRPHDCPRIAAWLTVNEKLLDCIVAASRKPHWFLPLAPSGDEALIGVIAFGPVQEIRDVARALSARAMLRVQEGRLDDAWQDLLTIHRLARLCGRGTTMVDALVGSALEGMACAMDRRFAASADLSADRLRVMSSDLAKLAPLEDLSTRVIDKGERFVFLDLVAWISRRGPVSIDLLRVEQSARWRTALNEPLSLAIDWNLPLEAANRWYDRVVATAAIPNRAARRRAFLELEREVDQLQSASPVEISWVSLLAPAKTLGDQVESEIASTIRTSYHSAFEAQDRSNTDLTLTRTYLALLAFRAENGRFPVKLNELVPSYLENTPRDFSQGNAFVYRTMDNSFVLYSLGPNGVDDGGTFRERGSDDDTAVLPP